MCPSSRIHSNSPIRRKKVVLRSSRSSRIPQSQANRPESRVLVINSTSSMAKEMTHQLTIAMPGCSIIYAPTFELAKWILKSRQIDLVVSSPVLPDGSITKLIPELTSCSPQPDLVIVGAVSSDIEGKLSNCLHKSTEQKKTAVNEETETSATELAHNNTKIVELGADIRNDLNNPLQEIVSMVFVAQSAESKDIAPTTQTALNAIEAAAKNMAKVVSGLEGKIRLAITKNV